ncbi:glycosyl transferase family protein [Legionella nagasakiensis]|uniref:glycosyl transferase family protein n=1 Tax=Legionella nagasakiensis TaxID=535290 RepID=UPI00105582C6|nr:glycosyl transferase family protein [Legionella nagasakiensis]
MPNETILIIYFLMWYLLVGLCLLFILSGLDDLFIDFYYWLRYVWRIWKTRHYSPLTYEQLLAHDEQPIAVLIPCWHEANVIATMLKHNAYSIDYNNYYFFVGVYPNDPETLAEVQQVAKLNKHVQCIIGKHPGPTNKAANLNGIYKFIKTFERTLNQSFTIFVLHDSEDIIHPLSFKFYNYLIPRKDMIQIPIFPSEVNYWNFTHWLYADEFAESHTKDIVVRESIGAHVPSAGVGTAFSRRALERLENTDIGAPFSTDSLTEDYRTSLALRVHGLKQIFLTRHILRMQWKKRWFFGQKYRQKPVKEIIATRALFPLEYAKAIRQKSRWIIGIVFQEWRHSRWPHGWRIRYTLAHDRKAFITHFINGFGYMTFIFWILYSFFTSANPEYPALQEQFNLHPWVKGFVFIAVMIMCERLIQRTVATFRIYGFIPAFLAIPRSLYGNILNLHALIRAYSIYFSSPKRKSSNSQPAWDKTEHQFPGSHLLVPYRRRLGDLLLENSLITREQLRQGLLEQYKTGERLGRILCRFNFINHTQLIQTLATQYDLSLFPRNQIPAARNRCIALLSKRKMKWLVKHGVSPLKVDEGNQCLTVAIEDPTNEQLCKKVMSYVAPYKTQFMLIDE